MSVKDTYNSAILLNLLLIKRYGFHGLKVKIKVVEIRGKTVNFLSKVDLFQPSQ